MCFFNVIVHSVVLRYLGLHFVTFVFYTVVYYGKIMSAIEEMSCLVNQTVTLDIYDVYEILSLLEQNPACKKYAELKAKRILEHYEFQQNK